MTLRDAIAFAPMITGILVGAGFSAVVGSSLALATTSIDVRPLARLGWLAIFIGAVLMIAVQSLDQLL